MRLAIELTSTWADRLRKAAEGLGIAPAVLTQPRLSFGDADAYPTLMAKAEALGFSLVLTHRNTRVGARRHGRLFSSFLVFASCLHAGISYVNATLLVWVRWTWDENRVNSNW